MKKILMMILILILAMGLCGGTCVPENVILEVEAEIITPIIDDPIMDDPEDPIIDDPEDPEVPITGDSFEDLSRAYLGLYGEPERVNDWYEGSEFYYVEWWWDFQGIQVCFMQTDFNNYNWLIDHNSEWITLRETIQSYEDFYGEQIWLRTDGIDTWSVEGAVDYYESKTDAHFGWDLDCTTAFGSDYYILEVDCSDSEEYKKSGDYRDCYLTINQFMRLSVELNRVSTTDDWKVVNEDYYASSGSFKFIDEISWGGTIEEWQYESFLTLNTYLSDNYGHWEGRRAYEEDGKIYIDYFWFNQGIKVTMLGYVSPLNNNHVFFMVYFWELIEIQYLNN